MDVIEQAKHLLLTDPATWTDGHTAQAVECLQEFLARSESMTFENYEAGVMQTAIYPGRGTIKGLMYTALGLGEAGEIQNKVKKILRDDGGKLTHERQGQLISEVGDLLWYIAAFCDEADISFEHVARANLKKLRDRAERGVLQGDGDDR